MVGSFSSSLPFLPRCLSPTRALRVSPHIASLPHTAPHPTLALWQMRLGARRLQLHADRSISSDAFSKASRQSRSARAPLHSAVGRGREPAWGQGAVHAFSSGPRRRHCVQHGQHGRKSARTTQQTHHSALSKAGTPIFLRQCCSRHRENACETSCAVCISWMISSTSSRYLPYSSPRTHALRERMQRAGPSVSAARPPGCPPRARGTADSARCRRARTVRPVAAGAASRTS